jgi:hypothetical protein
MDRQELIRLYPQAFHMAAPGAWPMIERHGLLCTQALLELFEVGDPQRSHLLTHRRPNAVTLTHQVHGTAVVRDNIPLTESKLGPALTDMTVEDWLRLLNSRVFFWLQRERLTGLLGARAYRDKSHLVITVDTRQLLDAVGDAAVRLSRINSGSTAYRAMPRGSDTFKTIADYPHPARRRPLTSATDVAELCVLGVVRDVVSVAVRADLHTPEGIKPVWQRPGHRG